MNFVADDECIEVTLKHIAVKLILDSRSENWQSKANPVAKKEIVSGLVKPRAE